MSYPIDTTIPAANNNPSADQPKMQTNFNNINGYVSVDHVAPGVSGNGFHKFVTYNAFAAPGAIVDPVAVTYTAAGQANTAHAQEYFKNSQGVFPTSAIRAVAAFTTLSAAGNIVPSNYSNINNPIVSTGTNGRTLTITLSSATIVNSDNIAVFVNSSDFMNYSWTFTNPTLVITAQSSSPPIAKVSVLILQI